MKHVPCELYLSVSHTVFEVKKSDRVRIVALRIQFQTRYFSVSDQNTTTQVRVIHSMGDIWRLSLPHPGNGFEACS
jgi:hypothetical protein